MLEVPGTLRDWEQIDSTGQNLAEEIRQYFIPDLNLVVLGGTSVRLGDDYAETRKLW